jgi:parvulin-like peptidyl-prolyl isomerase
VRRHPLLFGALAVLVIVGGVVAGGAFAVPATAITVDGASVSRSTLDQDLATIDHNQAFACYLDASVAVRSANQAGLPSVTGPSGAYNTSFVDFWLSEQINNLLIEQLASDQHLRFDATATAAGRADLVSSISSTLSEAAAATGQSAVCAASGQAIVQTLPSSFVNELVQAQSAGDLVLARAAGYGLGTQELSRYFSSHASQFQTICLSGIEVASQASANTVRAAIEAGESFAAAAQANSTDTTSAANGGVLGCFSANEGAYPTVASDTSGLSVGELSQPVANTGGSYLVLMVTSYLPAAFDAVIPAVRQAVLAVGSTKASKELSRLTKTANVSVDPRYGRWDGASGVGIRPPLAPAPVDVLNAKT